MARIEWRTKGGRAAVVTVELRREIRHLGTSDWTGGAITRDRGLYVHTEAWVDGQSVGTDLDTVTHPDVVAACGKLGIPAAQYEQILAAIAECEATPEYVEQEARRAAHEQEMDDLEASRRAIYRAMSAEE